MREYGEMMQSLGRIDGKIDGILQKQKDQDKMLDSYGDRLAELEKTKHRLMGIAAAVGVMSSFIVQFIT